MAEKKDKRGFFSKVFMNPTAEENSSKQEKTPIVTKTPGSFDTPFNTTPVSTFPTTSDDGQSKKQEYTERLKGVIQTNHDASPAYPNFALALKKLASRPIDEASKFAAVFATVEAGGGSTQDILSSAEFHIGKLKDEETQFESAVASKRDSVTNENQTNIQNLTARNTEIDEQMQKLAAEKQQNLDTIKTSTDTIQTTTNQLNSRANEFKAAFQEVSAEIENAKTAIQKYATPATA